MAEKNHTVIVGDLMASRQTEDRQRLAEQIPAELEDLAECYEEEFHAPLVLTRGIDELSGVLKRPAQSYNICRDLNTRLSPAMFRFAIVRGELDVGIGTGDARKMDGPAFHRAGDLIEEARDAERCYLFDLGQEDQTAQRLLNELAHVLHLFYMEWTDREREVVALYEVLNAQKKVARRLEMTQQAVSKTLRRIHWDDFERANGTITHALEMSGR